MTEEDGVRLPFRPRARILQLLGDQLIGTSRLAVFELVKNAYDADAEKVTVKIDGLKTENPVITIEDDGDGMSLQVIQDIWLVPAHDHRKLQRNSRKRTRLNRLPLGEKGLGRFAVHKLGDHIQLVTRAKGMKECVVDIDWSLLIKKEFLSEAEVKVVSREPEVFKDNNTGTRIIINKLRNKHWSRGEVRRLYRQITSISSPFKNRSDTFLTEMIIPDHPDLIDEIPDVDIILERAPWGFSFLFENGVFNWKYIFRGIPGIKLEPRQKSAAGEKLLLAKERDLDILGTDQSKHSNKAKKIVADETTSNGIGPVKGRFYVFDRDREIMTKSSDSQSIQKFLDENGGVRVYRDSIRVYNYGELGDDWLGLDLRRVNDPTRNISRNIIIGYIEINLEHSGDLTEKTNREGFIENDAYYRLRRIILGALAVLETERKIDKEHIRSLTGKDKKKEKVGIGHLFSNLQKVASKHQLSKELDPLINKVEKMHNEMRDAMLRAGLSGMGLAIVFHEIEQGVRILHGTIARGKNLESAQVQAQELVRMLDGFSVLLRKGVRKPFKISLLIRRVTEINKIRLRHHNIQLECPVMNEKQKDIERTFLFGLLFGALNNLFDNALYWLQVRWPDEQDTDKRKIFLNIDLDYIAGPAIIVADNGPGFQDDYQILTQPFFSRRPDGMGVGLYYTNMVMELAGGRLMFPDPEEVDLPEYYDGAVVALVFRKGE